MRRRQVVGRKCWLALGVLIFLVVMGVAWFLAKKLHHSPEEQNLSPGQSRETGSVVASDYSRGNIHDRKYEKMAVSLRLYSVYVRPFELKEPQVMATRLAKALSMEQEELLAALRSERSFVWIGRHIPAAVVEELQEDNHSGLYFVEEVQRLYTQGRTAAHVVGFSKEGQGLGGLEYYYDYLLRGLPPGESTPDSAREGGWTGGRRGPVILSLDLILQKKVEIELANLIKASSAKSGMAIVMVPGTGEILALACLPSFDPNRFWDFSEEERKNRVISSSIIPGRFGRLFMLAAAMELGRKPSLPVSDIITAEPAQNKDEQISSGRSEKMQASSPLDSILFSDPDGIRYSPYAFLVAKPALDEKEAESFSSRFGFDRKSGIDLPEEEDIEAVPFRLDNPRAGTRGIRLLRAFSSLVNGGKLVTPHLLKAVWDAKTNRLIERPSLSVEEVLKPETFESLRPVLDMAGGGDVRLLESYVPIASAGAQEIPSSAGEEVLQSGTGAGVGAYHGVLLGYGPARDTEVVLCISIDEAQVEAIGHSPLRESGGKIVKQALQTLREKEQSLQNSFFTVEQGTLYSIWKEFNKEAPQHLSLAASQQPESMPDVRQLSLRKALVALQSTGVVVTVNGTGKVVRQSPAPGTVLKPDTKVVLELTRDREQ